MPCCTVNICVVINARFLYHWIEWCGLEHWEERIFTVISTLVPYIVNHCEQKINIVWMYAELSKVFVSLREILTFWIRESCKSGVLWPTALSQWLLVLFCGAMIKECKAQSVKIQACTSSYQEKCTLHFGREIHYISIITV